MINSRDINELHPVLKRACEELKKRVATFGCDMLVTSTYRDAEYQNSLYEQGRSKPGRIVTNAKAGQSIHNYRLAFDICKNLRGHAYADNDFFDIAGRLGTEMGLVWGGNFKGFADKPHFEFTGGLSLAELASGKVLPEDFVMEWEKDDVAEISQGAMIILVNGNKIKVERVLKDGFNYIKLRDLDKLGFDVSYDKTAKIPVLEIR